MVAGDNKIFFKKEFIWRHLFILFILINCFFIKSILAAPLVDFIPPTPDDGAKTASSEVELTANITESLLGRIKFNWNGINYTLYDNNLVLMMNFDNVSALGENSTRVVDLSGNGNNGTVVNATWTSSGKYEGAFSFDGSGDSLYVNDNSLLRLTNNWTIGFWVKVSNTAQSQKYLVNKGNRYAILYGYEGSTIEFYSLGYTGDNPRTGSQIILNDTNWHHIVYSYDGSTWEGYKDGLNIFSLSKSFVLPVNAEYLFLGAASLSTGNFNGTIDEFRIWNRSLSEGEINASYRSNLYRYNSAWWNLVVNQSLGIGTHTYFVSVINKTGGENITETRTLNVGTSPVISVINPSDGQNLTFGTTWTWINITTNVVSHCKYSETDSDFDFATEGISLSNTDAITHSFNKSGLNFGQSYTLYYKCNNTEGYANPRSTSHQFNIEWFNSSHVLEPRVVLVNSSYTSFHWSRSDPTYSDVYNWWKTFLDYEKIPYLVMSDKEIENGDLFNGDDIKYPVIIAGEMQAISSEQIVQFRNFVSGGGLLISMGKSFSFSSSGVEQPEFLLSDVVGITKPASDVLRGGLSYQYFKFYNSSSSMWSGANDFAENSVYSVTDDNYNKNRLNFIYGANFNSSASNTLLMGVTNSSGGSEYAMLVYTKYNGGTSLWSGWIADVTNHHPLNVYKGIVIKNAIKEAFSRNNVPLTKVFYWKSPYKTISGYYRLDVDLVDHINVNETINWLGENNYSSIFYFVSVQVDNPLVEAVGRSYVSKVDEYPHLYVGSHHNTHVSLDGQTYSTAKSQLNTALDVLENIVGSRPKYFVAPLYQALKNSSINAILDNGINESGDLAVGLFPIFAYTTKPVEYNHSALNKMYYKSVEPFGTYPDTNNVELTDGKIGSGESSEEEYSGYKDTNLTIIIDLGEIKSGINTLKAGFMENTGVDIHYPTNVSFYASDDNLSYYFLGSNNTNDSNGWFSFTNETSFSAGHIKAEITSGGQWTFIDEIMVGDTIKIQDLTILNTSLLEIPITSHFDSDGSFDIYMQSYANNDSIKRAIDFYVNNSLFLNIYAHPDRDGNLGKIKYMAQYISNQSNIKDYSPTELWNWVSLRKNVNILNVTYNSTHVTIELENEFDNLAIELNTTKIVALRNSTSQLAYFNLNETMNDNYIITQLEDNKYTFAIITDKPNNITVQTLYANQEFNVTDYNNNTQSYSYFDKISDNQGFIHFESEGGVHEIEIIKSASSRDPALSPPPTNGGGYAPKTYYSDEKLPIEGNNFNLRVWDKIRFVVQENNHTLTMMQFNSTSARAKIESEPITTWIEKDVFYEFDLNNDSVNDVRVRYDGMNQSKAMIFIQEIVYSDEEGEIVVEEIEEERNLSWLWVLIILVVLGFVGWVIYNKKRR